MGSTTVIPQRVRPTDDELLAYFVDQTPSMAMQDYRRRCGFPPDVPSTRVLQSFFEREWAQRMGS